MTQIYAVGWMDRDRDNYEVFRHEDEFYATSELCAAEVEKRNAKARAWAAKGPGYTQGYEYYVEAYELIES